MVSHGYISDEEAEAEAEGEAELWIDSNLVGDAMDDFPSVIPKKTPEVNSIVTAAKHRTGDSVFQRNIAEEMNKISLIERETKFEEMHGISNVVEETEDVVFEALFEFEREIAAIEPKEAYHMAVQMDRSYVENTKFLLMFLRAELFDVRKAAERMVLFLEKKLKFFGPAALVRTIHMSDLDDDDIATLKSGVFQILPSRDCSGRPILFKASNCGPKLYKSLLSYCKCWWYSVISAFEEDEETQKRGAIVIVWWMDYLRKDPDVTPELRKEIFGAIKWLPMRPYNCIHICMDDSAIKHLLSRVQIALSPPEIRHHYKIHTGTVTEVLYKLMSFGIPTDVIPISINGGIKTKELHKWIARRKKKDDFLMYNRGAEFDKVDLPCLKDVLLAKGRPYQHHPGNLDYLSMVNEFLIEYNSASNRSGKRVVVGKLVNAMKAKFVRFLTKDKDDWWIESPEKELHDKIIKAFSHAAITARRKSPAYITKFTEPGPGKRHRIEPRMDGQGTNSPNLVDQEACCFIFAGH